MRLPSALLPHGVVEIRAWQRRFEMIGFSPRQAMRAAMTPGARTAYRNSNIAILHSLLDRHVGLIVDAGANQGQWLSSILRFLTSDRVLAFEPHPTAYAQLREQLADHREVEVYQLALGDHAHSALLNATRRSELSSLLVPEKSMDDVYANDITVDKQVPIEVRPLDDFVMGQAIDLLKVDVQGYDRPLLAGARLALAKTHVLLIEMILRPHYVGEDGFAKLYGLLTDDYGFSFANMAPLNYDSQGRATWTDAIFVHERLT